MQIKKIEKTIDNYEISANQAKKLFLQYDQPTMIRKFSLDYDGEFLYLIFVGEKYRISRFTGEVFRPDGRDGYLQAGFSEVMSVFDFLCHDTNPFPAPCGSWASVNSVSHRPRTVGVSPFHLKKYAARFDAFPDKAALACENLRGRRLDIGDLGCEIPVFSSEKGGVFVTARIKFYVSDEEFEPKLTILWDTDILKILRYETLFYVEGWLCERILSLCDA